MESNYSHIHYIVRNKSYHEAYNISPIFMQSEYDLSF